MYHASKTLRQTSLTFCQTILNDDLIFPTKEDLESAYRISGAKQFQGRLRDIFGAVVWGRTPPRPEPP